MLQHTLLLIDGFLFVVKRRILLFVYKFCGLVTFCLFAKFVLAWHILCCIDTGAEEHCDQRWLRWFGHGSRDSCWFTGACLCVRGHQIVIWIRRGPAASYSKSDCVWTHCGVRGRRSKHQTPGLEERLVFVDQSFCRHPQLLNWKNGRFCWPGLTHCHPDTREWARRRVGFLWSQFIPGSFSYMSVSLNDGCSLACVSWL